MVAAPETQEASRPSSPKKLPKSKASLKTTGLDLSSPPDPKAVSRKRKSPSSLLSSLDQKPKAREFQEKEKAPVSSLPPQLKQAPPSQSNMVSSGSSRRINDSHAASGVGNSVSSSQWRYEYHGDDDVRQEPEENEAPDMMAENNPESARGDSMPSAQPSSVAFLAPPSASTFAVPPGPEFDRRAPPVVAASSELKRAAIAYGDFAAILKKRGLEIQEQAGDGNCLFRAVSLQVYGDPSMHADIRKKCMDFMVRKAFFVLLILLNCWNRSHSFSFRSVTRSILHPGLRTSQSLSTLQESDGMECTVTMPNCRRSASYSIGPLRFSLPKLVPSR